MACASGEHAAFPGTLSIGTEALTACLIELGRHAGLHWPAVLLVNGHGGNATAIQSAVERLRYEDRACAAWYAGLPACLATLHGEHLGERREHRYLRRDVRLWPSVLSVAGTAGGAGLREGTL